MFGFGIWMVNFIFSETFLNLEHPRIGTAIFGLAILGIVCSLIYFIIYEVFSRIFKNKLGSLLALHALVKLKNYYMGSFGGGAGPSYESLSRKYDEWIKEEGIQDSVKIQKRKTNIKAAIILVSSIILFGIGMLVL